MKRKLQLLGLFAVLMLTALSQLSAQVITMTIRRDVGETIKLAIVGEGNVTIDGVKEDWQPSLGVWNEKEYTLTSQTIKIRGKVTELKYSLDRLSRLDASGCTALTRLWCYINELSSLDVSGCTALTDLKCDRNKLSRLDVSGCTALRELECSLNELSSLDVSKNTALTELECSRNKLSRLDVSKNTALTDLWCFRNKLSRLDVSKNTALTELLCYSNKLSSLDVSKNTALTELDCSNNQLTSLDVSKNTALTKLECVYNQLSSLDVSKNTVLTDLKCSRNKLSRLDVSKNTALTDLKCSKNKLSRLDVSKNTVLTDLKCSNNQLTRLTGCTSKKLCNVECYNNRLNATEMWRVINDLNDEDGDKTFIVFDNKDRNDELNQLTEKQIYKVMGKGWKLTNIYGRGRAEANADEVPEPTAIEGLDGDEALACYPNPATDFVSLKGLEPQAEVEVYSMAGACVLRGKADASGSLDLDVRQLAEGLYLVKTGNKTMKLEVKH